MTAIPPVPPVPSAVPGVAGADAGPSGGAPARPAQHLVDRFQALMRDAQPLPPDIQHAGGPSAIDRVMGAQQQALDTTFQDVDSFVANAQSMSIAELTAHQMQLMSELTVATFNLNVGSGLAQSGKSAVQTLFKNQ
ncbi:type III secretion protein HrpB2 [Burkholderia sp. BCC1977]|uniref:type III secretion protein HrpB2 n=1 Tax=Burkholderia sp. BCC1977 TaxID=2817440 RepID=UPI002ABD2F76|nr:type III secretion protein HrpB2 [Burkholderia sp. BCC1977]